MAGGQLLAPCVSWRYFFGVAAKSPPSSVYFSSLTFSFSSLVEEAIEDVEGPSEAAADPEELAKDQESGGEKDQSKWTGSVCGCSPARPPCFSPGGGRQTGQGAGAASVHSEWLGWFSAGGRQITFLLCCSGHLPSPITLY